MSVYGKSVDFYKGNYYIHRHQKNIGRMFSEYENNDMGMPSSNIMTVFNQLKKDASSVIINQYSFLFKNNIQDFEIDDNVTSLINEVFSDNANIDKLNKIMVESLQNQINSDKIQKIIQLEQNLDWSRVEPIINKALQDSQTDLKEINGLLTTLAKAVQLINTHGKSIGAAIINGINSNNADISQLGSNVFSQLKVVEEQLKDGRHTLAKDQIDKPLKQLKNLARFFMNKKQNDNKSDLTGSYIRNFVEKQIFSTAMGEAMSIGVINSAKESSALFIQNSINSIRGVGDKPVKFDYTDATGSYTNMPRSDVARQGKTDIRFDNVVLDLSYLFGSGAGQVTLGFGISNKAYKTLSFEGDDTSPAGYVKGGSIKLEKIFNMLTSNRNTLYLAYNTLAWTSNSAKDNEPMKNLNAPLLNLQDALFTRSVVYLFGSRGKDDFANFMLINGKLVSLWQIIKEATDHMQFSASSVKGTENLPLQFKLLGHQKFGSYLDGSNNSISMHQRVLETNRLVNEGAIEGHIDISKI